jgi:hypothetical protein
MAGLAVELLGTVEQVVDLLSVRELCDHGEGWQVS